MDPILYWNKVALEANRVSHTEPGGAQTGPVLSARALAIVHLAIHDAYFGIRKDEAKDHGLYLQDTSGLPHPGVNAPAAVAAAAFTTLSALYPSMRDAFKQARSEAGFPEKGADESKAYGRAVANAILAKVAIKAFEPGVNTPLYSPSMARGRHGLDPENKEQGFHGPLYGVTAHRIAVTREHELELPPTPNDDPGSDQREAYMAALAEVRAKGGAPGLATTTRSPEETRIGIFWAYDGVPKIGTPPRLYNQIVRCIAESEGNTPAQNARLFALVNAAMGDAGIFAWKEKYRHDLWRPVLGVQHQDPAWLPLGAPRTNTDQKSFTPPFPAYPSGHATFGAAAFQMVRRFYGCGDPGPDRLAFKFVSDELNGVSTDMDGKPRERHEREFKSLWHAIFENGLSRVFLGVHWAFDAFSAADVKNPDGKYKDPAKITYDHNVGGVPLGLAIADDIFRSGLVCPSQEEVAVAEATPPVQVQRTWYSR
jgi:vanadium chloroperoxidase